MYSCPQEFLHMLLILRVQIVRTKLTHIVARHGNVRIVDLQLLGHVYFHTTDLSGNCVKIPEADCT